MYADVSLLIVSWWGDNKSRSSFNSFEPKLRPMTRPVTLSLPSFGSALVMRWLVLVVIVLGTVISSIGGTSSHGLAAISATLHAAASSPDEQHGHVHEDQGGELVMVDQTAAADHLHHGADHSHDNAHVPPVAWRSVAPQLPGWWGLARPWIEMVQASRLERPPMG